jgi:transcriptional regulator with XRE-family HTH domain
MSSNPLNKKIGENIERYRLQSRKNIKTIASMLGLTETGYRNIERGITEAGTTKLFRISEILNVPVNKLLDVKAELKEQSLNTMFQPNTLKQDQDIYRICIDQYKEENQFLKKQLSITQELLVKAMKA